MHEAQERRKVPCSMLVDENPSAPLVQVVAAASAWCPNARLVRAAPAAPAQAPAPAPADEGGAPVSAPPTLLGWGEMFRGDGGGARALGAPRGAGVTVWATGAGQRVRSCGS